MVDESHKSIATTLEIRCRACGLQLSNKEGIEIGEEGLCRICTLDYSIKPNFLCVVSALTKGIYMEKIGIKNRNVALRNALKKVTGLPYWQTHKSECIQQEEIKGEFITNFIQMRLHSRILKAARESEDSFFSQDRFDIFIAHSWNGPDKVLVEPLVVALKKLGYSVWYDKEQGLEKIKLEESLEDAIFNARNCILIICREYFKDDTRYELEMLFKTKEKKNILPVWWKDIDSEFLKQSLEKFSEVRKKLTDGGLWGV